MKLILSTFCLLSFSLTVFAADVQPIKQTATNAAIELTKANYAYMKRRIDIQFFKATESGRNVKVELGIGSIDRPARMHNCVSVNFDENGYILNAANEIDSDTCE